MEPASKEIIRDVGWVWTELKRFLETNCIVGADYDSMQRAFPLYWRRIRECEDAIDTERDEKKNRAHCLIYVETWTRMVTDYLRMKG